MPLWIAGEPLAQHRLSPAQLYDAVTHHPAIVASARSLIESGSVKTVIPHDPPSVYVFQKEFAIIPRSRKSAIGSDRATTCHILIIASSRRVFAAHLDGSPGQMVALAARLRLPFFGEPSVEAHLAGGFSDERDLSVALGREILAVLDNVRTDTPVNLKTACVGPLNTMTGPAPIIRALALNTHTNTLIANGWFADRGPNADWRAACVAYGASPMLEATDPRTGDYWPDDRGFISLPDPRYLESVLNIKDNQTFLQLTSTSPDVEHDGFCDETRATLRYLLELCKQSPG